MIFIMAVTPVCFLLLPQSSHRPRSVKGKTQKNPEKSVSSGRGVCCKSVTFKILVNEGNLHQACKDLSQLCVS